MKKNDLNNWKRKEHFEFFKNYDDPFYNITANVDITELLKYSKLKSLNFFITSLFVSQKALDSVEELGLRIIDNEVYHFSKVNCGSTILNSDETFGFIYFDFEDDFESFYQKALEKFNNRPLKSKLIENPYGSNVVFYSVVPWISFNSISHAKLNTKGDSIPRIVFGKYYESNSKTLMPVSVEVNHALVDGIHIGKYFDKFSHYCSNPSEILI